MSDNEKLADSVTKILVVLCTAGIIWIANGISSLQQDQVRNEEWRNFSMQQIQLTTDFMKEPRFTEADFSRRVDPLALSINQILIENREIRQQVIINTEAVQALKEHKAKPQ